MLVNDVFNLLRLRKTCDLDLDAGLAGRRDADRSDSEHPLEQPLADLHVANVGVVHLVRVLGEDALAKGDTLIGHDECDAQHLKPPDQQDQEAEAEGCDEEDAQDEPDRVVPEHRRV